MIEIIICIYENEAEISSYKSGRGEAAFVFPDNVEGFLCLGSETCRLSGGKCCLKLQAIEDGEYTPRLITQNGTLHLPKIIKEGNTLFPKPYDDDFTRSLSKRERQLERKVKELEETVSRLTKSVYGTTLFN